MRKIFIIFFFFHCTAAIAQNTDSSKFVITLRPLGIVDFMRPNLTLGLQYYVKPKVAIEIQGGIMQSVAKSSFDYQYNINVQGYRLSAEVKYKLVRTFFTGVQIFHNNFTRSNDEYIWRSGRAYLQKTEVDRKFVVSGGHIKCGVMLNPGKGKMYVECYGGIGVRYKQVTIKSMPEDGEITGGNTNTSSDEGADVQPFTFQSDVNLYGGNEIMPSAMLGVSIGIKL